MEQGSGQEWDHFQAGQATGPWVEAAKWCWVALSGSEYSIQIKSKFVEKQTEQLSNEYY